VNLAGATGFDGAFNWQGSFGYFSDEQNGDLVRRYARSLRPGGRLLIDMPARQWMLRHFRDHGRRGDVEFRVQWRQDVQRTTTVYRDVTTGQSWCMDIRHYTPAQYRRLFRRAGLEVEAFHGDMSDRRYHAGCKRLYVVGRRT
jgi:SAM-dependent methyltransferase